MKTPININEKDLMSDWIDDILYDYNIMHDTPVLSAVWVYNTNMVRFTSMGEARETIMQKLHNELLQMFEPNETYYAEITKVNDYTLIIEFWYNDVL
jgi:hypothetical protein